MEAIAPQPAAAPTAPMVPPPMAAGGPAPLPVAASAPMPPMEDGGAVIKKSSGFKEWFDDINVVDVTVCAFIVGAILYSAQYFRFMMQLEKAGYADLKGKVNKLQSSVDNAVSEMNAAGRMNNQRGRKTPQFRIA